MIIKPSILIFPWFCHFFVVDRWNFYYPECNLYHTQNTHSSKESKCSTCVNERKKYRHFFAGIKQRNKIKVKTWKITYQKRQVCQQKWIFCFWWFSCKYCPPNGPLLMQCHWSWFLYRFSSSLLSMSHQYCQYCWMKNPGKICIVPSNYLPGPFHSVSTFDILQQHWWQFLVCWCWIGYHHNLVDTYQCNTA